MSAQSRGISAPSPAVRAPQNRTYMRELAQRFAAFNRRHPDVRQKFFSETLEVIRAGYRRYSADAVLHKVRWDAGKVKICNDWCPFYARLFREEFPQYAWIFNYKPSRADPPPIEPPRERDLFGDE